MNRLRDIFSTKTFKQSSITSVSTFINAGLGAAFYFFVAGALGSRDYGIFIILATTIAMLSGVVDLGTDQGIIRFVSRYRENKLVQERIMKMGLKIKFFSGLLTALIIFLFSEFISTKVLNQRELSRIFPLIGLGIVTQLLFSFSTSVFQALEKYFLWGGLFIGTNLIRLLSVLVLFALGNLNSFTTSVAYVLVPFLGFVFSFLFIKLDFFFSKNEFSLFRKVFNFNKWIMAFVVIAAFGSRVDIYFVTRFTNLSLVGLYGLVTQILAFFPQVTSALAAVADPKFASFTNINQNKLYTRKLIFASLAVSILVALVSIPFSMIVFSYTDYDFGIGFGVILILLISMVIFLSTFPIRDSIIYYFGKPRFFFWLSLVHLISVFGLCLLLVQKYGLIGASIAVLLGQVIIALGSLWYYNIQKDE